MSISVETFIAGLVMGSFALLLLTALAGRVLDWLTGRKHRNTKKVCRLCGMRFYAEGREDLVECPHCHALNERF